MQIKKFSAVEDTELLLKFGGNAYLTSFENLENSATVTNSYVKQKNNKPENEILITEYKLDYDYYAPCIVNGNIDITFNKIDKLVKFTNLTNMYDLIPINLPGLAITSFNSIIDYNSNISDLADARYIKNTTYNDGLFSSMLELNGILLNTELGYMLGQWLARGFIINKPQNKYNGCVSLPVQPQHLELLVQKLNTVKGISYLHKVDDDGEYIILLNNEINDFVRCEFTFRKTFPAFLYDTNSKFINGILYGIFHTNGTITFNKQRSRAFLTIKFINYEFAKNFVYFLMVKFGVTGSFSKMPNDKCCKISVNLNQKLKAVLDGVFTYHYTTNSNKLKLWDEVQTLTTTGIDKVPVQSRKSDCSTGYNLTIPGATSMMLLNGILIPVL